MPTARLRFRAADDQPDCFYIEVHAGAAPRSYRVFVSPAPGGSQLEFRDLGDAASVVTAIFVVGLVAATWHSLGFLSLLLALPSAVLLRVAAESSAGEAEQAEVFAALVSAFEPLRRPGFPYRAVRDPRAVGNGV
ncbi:hypothetical protein [Nannocystis punicea]|uniref:Uncharacterized protein n=1 Tax=Nannocystis punicea TaxID=2995304 RepID=A0ABY7H3I9_9BACT|nr:hypothetical protein [Nannocystis poenicansa]WAS93655.1 hypothetical protein O0S08_46580 [Nannocystis poenicansa]